MVLSYIAFLLRRGWCQSRVFNFFAFAIIVPASDLALQSAGWACLASHAHNSSRRYFGSVLRSKASICCIHGRSNDTSPPLYICEDLWAGDLGSMGPWSLGPRAGRPRGLQAQGPMAAMGWSCPEPVCRSWPGFAIGACLSANRPSSPSL